jgi:hypothetical protein
MESLTTRKEAVPSEPTRRVIQDLTLKENVPNRPAFMLAHELKKDVTRVDPPAFRASL